MGKVKVQSYGAALLVLLAAHGNAWAWDSKGHMVVASIAYAQLTADQRNQFSQILRQHPDFDRYLAVGAPEAGPARDEYIFLKAATWPDAVRAPSPFKLNSAKYSHPEWHFVNRMHVLPGDDADAGQEGKVSTGENILTALPAAEKVLQSADSTPADKAISLCWILHLVGDIHQPLHCTSLITLTLRPPEGDRGGNEILVTIPDAKGKSKTVNLHALWDDLLGKADLEKFAAADVGEFTKLAAALTAECPVDSLPELKNNKTLEFWSQESFTLAKKSAYLDDKLLPPSWTSTTHVELPDDYVKNATRVAHRQITLAGYRLAALLATAVKQTQAQ